MALHFEPRGEEHLKNISEPVSIYSLDLEIAATRPVARTPARKWPTAVAAAVLLVAGSAAAGWYFYGRPSHQPPPSVSTPDSAIGIPVVLVLPFQNLTGDSNQDNLGLGITEDLRDMLWNFPEFQIVSGTSSIATENVSADIKDVARKFGAQFVIEGTVRRTGDTLVITAQLIDGTTDTHFWSTRFDQVIGDPVATEKAAANKLSASLGGMTGKMREAYERIAWTKDEDDLTEFDYYVRGHTHHMRFTPEEVAQAGEIYAAGLKRYPDSALLRMKAAVVSFYAAGWTYAEQSDDDLARTITLMSEARETLTARRKSRFEEYYLHWISAPLYQIDRAFARCVAESKAAVELTPYDPWVRGTSAYNLAECGGNLDEAAEWTKQAIQWQPDGPPHDPEYYLTALAWIYYLDDRCSDAVAVIQSMKNQPLTNLAACQIRLGEPEAARDTMAVFVKNNADWTLKNEAAYPMIDSLLQRWLEDIRAAGLREG